MESIYGRNKSSRRVNKIYGSWNGYSVFISGNYDFGFATSSKTNSKIFSRKKENEPLATWRPQATTTTTSDEKDVVAAITAAIIHYNNQKG